MKTKVTCILLCLMLSAASLRAQQTPAIVADSLVKAGWVLFGQQNLHAEAASNFRQAIAYNFYGLTSAILATGEGKSPETARTIVSVPDEYLVMNLLGLEMTMQALHETKGHMFDSVDGKLSDDSSATLWFNIDKPYHALGRSFGK